MPIGDVPILDEEGSDKPSRGVGSQGGGFGGGDGGGGGFGAFSGSGFFNPFSGGRGQGLPGGRGSMMGGRRLMGDNIPAWLSEGEFVMNPVSSGMFGPQLEAMNDFGNSMRTGGADIPPSISMGSAGGGSFGSPAGMSGFAPPVGGGGSGGGSGGGGRLPDGFAYGGYVRPEGYNYGGPVRNPFANADGYFLGGLVGLAGKALPFISGGMDFLGQQQAQDDQMADARLQYFLNARQQPQGYATGGWAGMQPTGFGRQMMGKAGRPAGGFTMTQGGQTQRPPQTYQTMGGNQQAGGPMPGPFSLPGIGASGRDAQGFVGTYDPRNPWAHRTGNVNPGAIGDMNRQIGNYGQQGYYNPGGSQAVRGAMRDQALSDARGFGEQAYLSADVGGMDPAAAAAYRTQALANAGRGVGDAMTRYNADLALQEQQYARDLMGQAAGWDYDAVRAQRDFNYAKNLPKK